MKRIYELLSYDDPLDHHPTFGRKSLRKIRFLDSIIEEVAEDTPIENLQLRVAHRFHHINNHRVIYKNTKIVGVCCVCKLSILSNEDIIECPICHGRSHRPHFLEWLKIKGYCPNCTNTLIFNGLNSWVKKEDLKLKENVIPRI